MLTKGCISVNLLACVFRKDGPFLLKSFSKYSLPSFSPSFEFWGEEQIWSFVLVYVELVKRVA